MKINLKVKEIKLLGEFDFSIFKSGKGLVLNIRQ